MGLETSISASPRSFRPVSYNIHLYLTTKKPSSQLTSTLYIFTTSAIDRSAVVSFDQHLSSRRHGFKTPSTVCIMDHNTQKAMPSQFQVLKVFPQRGSLCLHRLLKLATFTCNRCSLGKTSKLVAFTKDKWDEPVCNGCYGYLTASKTNDARGTQDNPVGVTAATHSRQQPKSRKARKSAHRDRKAN